MGKNICSINPWKWDCHAKLSLAEGPSRQSSQWPGAPLPTNVVIFALRGGKWYLSVVGFILNFLLKYNTQKNVQTISVYLNELSRVNPPPKVITTHSKKETWPPLRSPLHTSSQSLPLPFFCHGNHCRDRLVTY